MSTPFLTLDAAPAPTTTLTPVLDPPAASRPHTPTLVSTPSWHPAVADCRRAQYWERYVAPFGTAVAAPPEAVLAHRLSHLDSVAQAIQDLCTSALHAGVRAMRAGGTLPDVAAAVESYQSTLTFIRQASVLHRHGWAAVPQRGLMLCEDWYAKGGLPMTTSEMRARALLRQGVTAVHAYLAQAFGGPHGHGTVEAQLPPEDDRATLTRVGETLLVLHQSPPLVLHDRRTGAATVVQLTVDALDTPAARQAARERLARACVPLRARGAVMAGNGRLTGHVIALGGGADLTCTVTPAAVDRAEAALWLEAREWHTLHARHWEAVAAAVRCAESTRSNDATLHERQLHVVREAYAPTVEPSRCDECPFAEVCLPTLGR